MIEAFLRDPALGWDYARMVHGDQSIALHRPVHAGDELSTVIHVDDLRTRAGNHMLTLRCEVTDAAGAAGRHDTLDAGHRGRGRDMSGFDDVEKGYELPPLTVHVTRADLVRYAGASGRPQPDPLERPRRHRRSGCPA